MSPQQGPIGRFFADAMDDESKAKREPRPEFIVCSAIWVDDGIARHGGCFSYPATGILFTGWRHNDCFVALNAWAGLLPDRERWTLQEQLAGLNQGFMTSTGRYVDRREAWNIAHAADQYFVPGERKCPGELFSEDIY